jgi:hypothetical protein
VRDVLDAVAGLRDGVVAEDEDVSLVFTDPALLTAAADALAPWLLATWLRERHALLHAFLDALGALTASADDGVPRLDLGAVSDVLGAPEDLLSRLLEERADAAVRLVGHVLAGVGAAPPADDLSVAFGVVSTPEVPLVVPPVSRGRFAAPASAVGVASFDVSATTGSGPPAIAARIEGLDALAGPVEIIPGWTVTTSTDAAAGGAPVGFVLTAAGPVADLAGGADEASLTFAGSPPQPWILVGAEGATRLELAGLTLALDLSHLSAGPEISLSVGTTALRLVIPTGESGAFFAALLGGDVEVDVGLDVGLSNDGLVIAGGAGFAVALVLERTLGIVTVHRVDLALAGAGAGLVLTATGVLSARLGPFSVTVDGIGLAAEATSGMAGRGALGDLDVALAFRPPGGLGFSIEAGVVSGGGYIVIDPDGGGFAGVLQLDLLGIGICAVGIVETDLPGGEWSVFFALFIDLPSIQLGFGFTLTGVGGLAGVNRTLDTVALESAVRSGGIDDVLFPDDPVANAPRIIDELGAMFPASDGRYVFGPVVRIGWGTPTLIEAELGVVISLPDPIVVALIGTISAVLPTEDVPLIAIHVDVAGIVDAAEGTVSIDSSLHDSWVVGFALSGDMALRADFTGFPSFLMSMGGFHPGFQPIEMDAFPTMRRLALGISAAPVLDVHFECYFAITSNSVQFGSAFTLTADIAGFGIDGATEFDAVVQFSPFLVVTHLGFHVTITAASVDLAGVWLEASLEGPNPWYVVGTARFKLLGIEERIRIDERIGAPVPEAEVEEADPLALLREALDTDDAWAAVATPSSGVVLADPVEGDELAATPDGTVVVSQRAVPLGLSLDKLGDAPLGDPDTTYAVEPVSGSLPDTGAVQDWFAPGYFFALGSTEQLSAPSFELLDAGIAFGGGEAIGGQDLACTLDYEQILRDPELGEDGAALGAMALTATTAVTMATAATARFGVEADADPVRLAEPAWAVTQRNTGDVLARTATWSAAHQSEAGGRRAAAVVPSWEAP